MYASPRNFRSWYRWNRLLMKSICTLTAIFLSLNLFSQVCALEGVKYRPKSQPGVKYSVSHGYCYHYSSTTFETGYKNHLLTVTSMYRNLSRATPRMQDEMYVGYTYDLPLNRRVHTGGSIYGRIGDFKPVYRWYLDYKLIGPIHAHGSAIHIHQGMTHLVAGLKLII